MSATIENTNLEPKQQRFEQFLNQIGLYQEGSFTDVDIQILKSSYEDEQDYHIVFLNNEDDQLYKATYKAGHFISLNPSNEKIEENLSYFNHYPQNIITDIDKTQIYGITNNLTRDMQSYKSIRAEMQVSRLSYINTFERSFDIAIKQSSPVDRVNDLEKLKEKIQDRIKVDGELEKLHQKIYPYVQKVKNDPKLQEGIEFGLSVEFDAFEGHERTREGRSGRLFHLDKLVSSIVNLEVQNLRSKTLDEDEKLFSNINQAVAMNRFPIDKPFEMKVTDSLKKYTGIQNYMEHLVDNQITKPQKIIQHYVDISESISDYVVSQYTHVDEKYLSNYAKDALNKAIEITQTELTKNDNDFKLDLGTYDDFTYSDIKEVEKNLKAIANIEADELISFKTVINELNLVNDNGKNRDSQKAIIPNEIRVEDEKKATPSNEKINDVQEIER